MHYYTFDVWPKEWEEEEPSSVSVVLEWQTKYDHALKKHGSISAKVKRSVIVGPSKAGKSSLKHLLVHNTPKAVKESTGVMDTPEVVRVSSEQYAVEDGSSAWQMVNSDIMRKSLHACITNNFAKLKQGKWEEEAVGLIAEEVEPEEMGREEATGAS